MVWSPYAEAAGRRGEAIASAYERHRGGRLEDISRGGDPRLSAVFAELHAIQPPRASADLISRVGSEIRVIEVKSFARGGGDLTSRGRQVATWRALGHNAWLYVVTNVMVRSEPDQLWLVRDPAASLPWTPAERRFADEGGRGHEGFLGCSIAEMREVGTLADLDDVELPEPDLLSRR
ncbi:hypothetical protein [uncultured Cellulomonas sp.]|uniref:hypothetical protein n=1 Tax=uncultured Cellulomonas sp. TaxID=189682 RepID=UPI0028E4A317|nr:hypothetical protein [uncultured Cellulomonas sp.]